MIGYQYQQAEDNNNIGYQIIISQSIISQSIGSQSINYQGGIGSQSIGYQDVTQVIGSQNQISVTVSTENVIYDPGICQNHSHSCIVGARYLQSCAILLGGCYGLLPIAHGLRMKSQPVGILISKSFRFKVFGEPAIAAMATVD